MSFLRSSAYNARVLQRPPCVRGRRYIIKLRTGKKVYGVGVIQTNIIIVVRNV